MAMSNNDISDCLKKLRTEKQIVKILKNQIEKLNAELKKKYKKKGQKGQLGRLYRHLRSTDQIVDSAIAESKNTRKKKQAIHKYNQKRKIKEDAAYAAEEAAAAAEEEARVATANAGLRDFINRHRVDDAALTAADPNYKKRDGEKEWQKLIAKITKTRHSPPPKGGSRRTRRRRRKKRRSRRRRKRRTRRRRQT